MSDGDRTDNVSIANSDNTKIVSVITDGAIERLAVDANVSVTNPSGATVTEGKATITPASSVIKVLNSARLSLILVNDSSEVIFISKSGTAVLNEGIRLNKKGGSAVIEDYKGAVSGIAASGSNNITFSEVATP